MHIILKSFYILFFLLGVSCIVGAEVRPLPKAVMDQPAYTFPPAIAGAEVSHAFTIGNQGDAPLNIVGVQTGWGCLAASYPRQIPPGGTDEIILKVKTDGDAGKTIRERATVYVDDPDNAIIELTLTGDVISPVELIPQTARLMGPVGTPVRTGIKIIPAPGNPFTVTGAKVEDGGNIAFSLENKADADLPYFILEISNTRKDPGRYSDKIILTTTSAINPEVTVRVFGIIRESGD